MNDESVRLMQILNREVRGESSRKGLIESAGTFWRTRALWSFTTDIADPEARQTALRYGADMILLGYAFLRDWDGLRQFATSAGVDWETFIQQQSCAELLLQTEQSARAVQYNPQAIAEMAKGADLGSAEVVARQLLYELKES